MHTTPNNNHAFLLFLGNTITSDPSDQTAKPGDMVRFVCTFTGSTSPTWYKIDENGNNQVAITPGTTVNGFTYSSFGSNLALLSFTATKNLNRTMYYCTLPLIKATNSSAAQLLVYGKWHTWCTFKQVYTN